MKRHSYARLAVALLAGTLFGFGLSLSGMLNPARVLAYELRPSAMADYHGLIVAIPTNGAHA